jgi:hypothetical protein
VSRAIRSRQRLAEQTITLEHAATVAAAITRARVVLQRIATDESEGVAEGVQPRGVGGCGRGGQGGHSTRKSATSSLAVRMSSARATRRVGVCMGQLRFPQALAAKH